MKQSQSNLFVGAIVIVSLTFGAFLVYIGVNRFGGSGALITGEETANPVPAVIALADGSSYELTAAPTDHWIGGRKLSMLSYNGTIPGPIIHVTQGSEIRLTLKNQLTNDTTLHAHGVRMENAFDGVPDVTQAPIRPGESFTYTLKFPDPGMYWYHPHVREDRDQELGLYGVFMVTPSKEDYWTPATREVPVVLDDILLENGTPVAFPKDRASFALMGRFGNTMLVNGETDWRLRVKAGERSRLYFLNAANTRPFRVGFRGVRMKLVGADGGVAAQEAWVERVLIGPSERAIVEITFDKSGSYELVHETPEKTVVLGRVEVEGDRGIAGPEEPLRHASSELIPLMRASASREPDKTVRLDIDMGMMGGTPMMGAHGGHMGGGMMGGAGPDGIEWENPPDPMNARSDSKMIQWKIVDDATGNKNDEIEWAFKRGTYQKIRIVNDPNSAHPMQHPIHLHGQRFLVVTRDGLMQENPVWKDTVFVKAGETVDLLVDMSNPGEWAFHCHIPEHMESGMMSMFRVD